MGFYINPPDISKEEWLQERGRVVMNTFTWEDVLPNTLPVVLIDNGAFTAAGIAYSEKEFKLFTDPMDNRAKVIFLVSILDLLEVCPYVKDMISK